MATLTQRVDALLEEMRKRDSWTTQSGNKPNTMLITTDNGEMDSSTLELVQVVMEEVKLSFILTCNADQGNKLAFIVSLR